MGLFSSVSKVVDKVSNAIGFTNTTTGIAKLIQDETGMSPSQQYATGATVGFANMLGGAMSGSDDKDGNSGLLSALFGSSDGSSGGLLGNILGTVVKGAVGIGADYFSNQQYYKDQTKLNEQKFGYDKQLAQQQYQYDTKMADTAYQRDVAMWNMQNAYNAPSAQMARLQQAGLNPNLVYGGGSVTGNTAGSAPSYRAPSYPQVQYPGSKASKLDLMRNVLGIFDQYQSIKNQALDNQRQNARIALQAEALRLQDEREKHNEKEAERRYKMMMANFGLQEKKFDYQMRQPSGTVKNLKGLEDYAAEKMYSLTQYLAPRIYDWWHRDTSVGSGADLF